MIVLICLIALAAWGVIATLVSVARDGYRSIPSAQIAR
jgi:hypothetical protein